MGTGYEMICKKCGYSFSARTGVGYLFPTVYEDTVKQSKEGKLGKEIKDFFHDHPDGVINAEDVTLCCNECGHLFTGQDLTMYLPKRKSETLKFSL